MIRYIKYKINKMKALSMFYKVIVSFMENQSEIIDLFQKIYTVLKDTPMEELRSEMIEKMAEIVYENNNK